MKYAGLDLSCRSENNNSRRKEDSKETTTSQQRVLSRDLKVCVYVPLELLIVVVTDQTKTKQYFINKPKRTYGATQGPAEYVLFSRLRQPQRKRNNEHHTGWTNETDRHLIVLKSHI